MAAWACQFNGARGGMYESSEAQFVAAVSAILEGDGKPQSKRSLFMIAIERRPSRCGAILASSIGAVHREKNAT